ncbi:MULTISPECIES: cell division protein ZapA [Persicobacter]|uniref:Cell division protein ZapA n=1 Tax=Persicobacter diffluens TaxID=981 RepID=A0AAN4VY95_9BACT|nr:cell division protein ZapA [Persicobacter sp. CCB-QB2]GJM61928.1 hypothetical protein PEDI_24800 [Persicobacter diffluens]
MGDLSIKLKIADREYPMKVAMEDEDKVRQVAAMINDKIKDYRSRYRCDDRQDLLAMILFDSMVNQVENHEHENAIEQKVSFLNDLLNNSL